ncbi:hypothetical protein [Xanthomonas phage DMF5-T1]|nr:hypothetical protein [Xanthomonas phage DMF5-T1]
MAKYVPIRSERSFRRHKAAGARFEVNSPENMEEGNDPLPPDTYFTPHSGWVSPYRGVEGARSHLRAGSMAVRAVYDEVTALSCRVISAETVITKIAEAIGVVQKKVNEKAPSDEA